MIYINNFRDLEKYGINMLTGEACALSYRGLFDLTRVGLSIVERVIGAVEIKAPSDYNGGDAVASLLMPYAMFEPLAVFALFEVEKVQQVYIYDSDDTHSGQHIVGVTPNESERDLAHLKASEDQVKRILTYPTQRDGITHGMSNTHQMSGRTA